MSHVSSSIAFYLNYLPSGGYTKPHWPLKTSDGNSNAIADSSVSESLEEKWCCCRRGEDVGDTIMYESKKRVIEWFRLECQRTHALIPKGNGTALIVGKL